jgi:uncharacterized membrane protein
MNHFRFVLTKQLYCDPSLFVSEFSVEENNSFELSRLAFLCVGKHISMIFISHISLGLSKQHTSGSLNFFISVVLASVHMTLADFWMVSHALFLLNLQDSPLKWVTLLSILYIQNIKLREIKKLSQVNGIIT